MWSLHTKSLYPSLQLNDILGCSQDVINILIVAIFVTNVRYRTALGHTGKAKFPCRKDLRKKIPALFCKGNLVKALEQVNHTKAGVLRIQSPQDMGRTIHRVTNPFNSLIQLL